MISIEEAIAEYRSAEAAFAAATDRLCDAIRKSGLSRREESNHMAGLALRPGIEIICAIVAAEYRVSVSDILGRRRFDPIAKARRDAVVLALQLLDLNSNTIAHAFGLCDHTAVLHHERNVRNYQEVDLRFAARFASLRERCAAALAAREAA